MIFTSGCASEPKPTGGDDVIFVVHGVGGAGSNYNGLLKNIAGARAGNVPTVKLLRWGAPPPLFFLDFQNEAVHRSAEAKFVDALVDWQDEHRNGRIDVVGFSAGCGVALGGLANLPAGVRVHSVLLLAPSVSPGYDLRPALARIDGSIHAFASDRDVTFLKWRTSTFGTYDNVRTPAAGHVGFSSIAALSTTQQSRISEHRYDMNWQNLDHDGGHFGYLSEAFVRAIVAPLLD